MVRHHQNSFRSVTALAAIAGNAVEWFEFTVYGYLAVSLSQAFFPQDNSKFQLLSSFGVFAVGFLMRPIGSLVLGPLGDLI